MTASITLDITYNTIYSKISRTKQSNKGFEAHSFLWHWIVFLNIMYATSFCLHMHAAKSLTNLLVKYFAL